MQSVEPAKEYATFIGVKGNIGLVSVRPASVSDYKTRGFCEVEQSAFGKMSLRLGDKPSRTKRIEQCIHFNTSQCHAGQKLPSLTEKKSNRQSSASPEILKSSKARTPQRQGSRSPLIFDWARASALSESARGCAMSSKSEYDRLINDKWRAAGFVVGGDHIPTDEQAMRGCRALYRKVMGKPWKGPVKLVRRKNQYTWIRRGVLVVNPNRPDYWGRTGWPDMVHMISHLCHRKLRPNERPHSLHQTNLETMLTSYVLSDGFSKYRKAA